MTFVHRYIPTEARDAPTLLLLHGTGGDEEQMLPLGPELHPHANLLSPRGRVLENGMPRFFRRLALGVFDVEDLVERTHELADFVVEACANYDIDPEKVIAVGYSNGANIAASLLLLRPEMLSAAVLFRVQVPFDPPEEAAIDGTPVFLGAGRLDELISPEETEKLAELLRSRGADVTLRWSPSGHQLSYNDVDAAKEWIAARGMS